MDTRGEIREFPTSRRARITYGFHINSIKHFRHSVVGELSLNFERLELAADPGLTILTYTAEPGSRDADALKLLGSWAATPDQATAPALEQESPWSIANWDARASRSAGSASAR